MSSSFPRSSLDLICLSHLRWDFVFQRPQHLMTRCARERRVFFVEEPVRTASRVPEIEARLRENGVCVVVPRIPEDLSPSEEMHLQRALLDDLLKTCRVR